MYGLFKKLRQKFLAEGKPKGYYRYALGELVLVMIGILLAMQVNNWNEERKEKRREKLVLENLHQEIEANLVILERGIRE